VAVQELVGDVSQNGGAARGDAALGHLDEEAGEKLPDVGAGGELGEFGEEFGGEIVRVGRSGLRLGVTETKAGARVHDGKAALAAAGSAMLAARAFGGS
jgi:hypothetical protein